MYAPGGYHVFCDAKLNCGRAELYILIVSTHRGKHPGIQQEFSALLFLYGLYRSAQQENVTRVTMNGSISPLLLQFAQGNI